MVKTQTGTLLKKWRAVIIRTDESKIGVCSEWVASINNSNWLR